MNLPEQECCGLWCPAFLNLRRVSTECVGRYVPVKTIPLSSEEFCRLKETGIMGEESGLRLRKLISSPVWN